MRLLLAAGAVLPLLCASASAQMPMTHQPAASQDPHAPMAPAAPTPPGAPAAQGADSPASQALMAAMQRMNTNMNGPMTGDPDRDFVMMMLPHHQGAIDMARVELKWGEDAQLRALAREIIAAQTKEIALMRRWQARHGQRHAE